LRLELPLPPCALGRALMGHVTATWERQMFATAIRATNEQRSRIQLRHGSVSKHSIEQPARIRILKPRAAPLEAQHPAVLDQIWVDVAGLTRGTQVLRRIGLRR
jgi:hypothetical protein